VSELELFPAVRPEAEALLADLNDAQRAAVTAGDGPCLVVAGAGTGKTRVLTRRVAWLIASRRALPSQILALTFTDKAAGEMEERVDQLVPFGYADATIATFHAFGHRLVSDYGFHLGLPNDVRLLSGQEPVIFLRERLFDLPLDRLRPAGDPTRHLGVLVRHMSRMADEDLDPVAVLAHAEERRTAAQAAGDGAAEERAALLAESAACAIAYRRLLLEEGCVDFPSLLTLALRLVREHPAVLEELRARYRWILVAEFQDTNSAQFELVKALGGDHPNLMVVGDDDQSIYKFRGAAISNILGFREAFPSAATHVLVENYRSTEPILECATRLIHHNDPDRLEIRLGLDKRLRARADHRAGAPVGCRVYDTPSSEADALARRIQDDVAAGRRRYGDFAVLVRRHAAAEPVAQALAAANVPARWIGGSGLFDRPEVAAALEALRALADPLDGRALWMLAASAFYDVPALDLMSLASRAERAHRPLEAAMREAVTLGDAKEIGPDGRAAMARLLADLDAVRPFALRHASGETLYRYLGQAGVLERLTAAGDAEADVQVQNLARLFDLTRAFRGLAKRDRIADFVRHLDLLREAGDHPAAAEPEIDEDAVHLMTVHKAKGLEFPVVFLVGLEANHFPGVNRSEPLPFPDELLKVPPPSGDAHRAEERRLFYVGLTRAREELELSCAVDHGGTRRWKPSPFVLEALDRTELDVPVTRATTLEAVRRHRARAPLPAPVLAPIPAEQTITLSAHQVESWRTCPLQYKNAHVLRIPSLPHHTAGYGLALHNAIRQHYQAIERGRPLSEDEVVRAFEASWSGEGFITAEHEQQRLEQGREAIRSFHRRETQEPSRPALVESSFRVAFGTNELRGRFDRVDERAEGPVIVDFKSSDPGDAKTANERAAKSLQLGIYALAFERSAGRRPAAVELHFIGTGHVGRAEVTADTLEDARDAIEGAAEGIRARAFEPTPSYHACNFCAFRTICSVAVRGAYGGVR
jgi:DNA helicase-2/ATP-dependent DNA helicase PcrA